MISPMLQILILFTWVTFFCRGATYIYRWNLRRRKTAIIYFQWRREIKSKLLDWIYITQNIRKKRKNSKGINTEPRR